MQSRITIQTIKKKDSGGMPCSEVTENFDNPAINQLLNTSDTGRQPVARIS